LYKNEKKEGSITKGVLTDSSYMVNGVVLWSFFRQIPFEILGHTTPRLALKEVVEITNRVCHERIWRPDYWICKIFASGHGRLTS
jgi:hypothetical protein